MTDQELKKLSRTELIEIIYELQKRAEEKDSEIEALTEELKKKEISVAESGSLAEASLRLNGVFESAQAAADQYMQSLYSEVPEAERIIASAERRRDEILDIAKKKGYAMLASAEKQARGIVTEAKRYAAGKKEEIDGKVTEYLRLNSELRAIFEGTKPDEKK